MYCCTGYAAWSETLGQFPCVCWTRWIDSKNSETESQKSVTKGVALREVMRCFNRTSFFLFALVLVTEGSWTRKAHRQTDSNPWQIQKPTLPTVLFVIPWHLILIGSHTNVYRHKKISLRSHLWPAAMAMSDTSAPCASHPAVRLLPLRPLQRKGSLASLPLWEQEAPCGGGSADGLQLSLTGCGQTASAQKRQCLNESRGSLS